MKKLRMLLIAFVPLLASADGIESKTGEALESTILYEQAVKKSNIDFKNLELINIDPSSRQSVVNAYHNVYLPQFDVPMNWTGSVSSCSAGTNSLAFREATMNTVNYYRAMASLPPVAQSDSLDKEAQSAALMMAANGGISHNPPSSWICYNKVGAAAAAQSNLSMHFTGAGPVSIRQYMVDNGSSNKALGHRRWVLYPPAVTFGTGDASVPYPNYANYFSYFNVLKVISNNNQARPDLEIVAWPPKGHVPVQILYERVGSKNLRWSFSLNYGYRNRADFSNAIVTMKEKGQSVVTNVIARNGQYGDPSINWETPNLSLAEGEEDRTFDITVSNISGTTNSSFSYQVTIIDPNLSQPSDPDVFKDSFE